jgi:hypothetical protein
MSIRMALFSLFVWSLTVAQDRVQSDNSAVILHGSNYVFATSIPQGWTLDSAGAITGARDIMLYKSKGTIKWHAVITFAAATKAVEGKNTLKNLLGWFAKVDSASSVPITEAPSMTTKDKRTAILKQWIRQNQFLTHGCVAYIDDEEFVAVISLMTENQQDFESYLLAFRQVIESYSSVASGKRK